MRPYAVGTVAVLLAAGCSGPYSNPAAAAKETTQPIEVKARRLHATIIPEVVTATGELYAQDVASLNAKIIGRLEKIHVDLGSRVEPRQVVAEIEEIEYRVRMQQAEALVEQSRARLGLAPGTGDEVDPATTATVREAAAILQEARLNFGRISQLLAQGILSRTEFDRGEANLRLAEARHQAAIEQIYQTRAQLMERRALLMVARKQLDETALRAPFAGAVTQRQAAIGELLNVGSPVVTIVRLHPLRLRLEIPERLAPKIRFGQLIDVRMEDSRLRAGRVVRLSPAIQTQNRSLLVEGEIPNEDGALRPGSFVEGSITVDPNALGIAVPARALLSFAGVDRIFVVQNGTLAERVVKLGRHLKPLQAKMPASQESVLREEQVEVLMGLAAGEMLVVEPHDRLASGQKARAVEK
jgi:RND family efflux transporter MFP subunit